MIKAVFFDMDGTLFSHTTKSVPKSTRESLKRLRARGIRVYLSTGRHITLLSRFPLEGITFDGYVTINGQICLDAERKLICGNPFPPKSGAGIAKIFNSGTYSIILEEEDKIYINFADERAVSALDAVSSEPPEVGSYDGSKSIYQIITFFKRGEEVPAELLASGDVTRWNDCGIDIIPYGGGKAAGIKRFLKTIGISPAECAAFGDAENDAGMLELVGLGIAMGNGDAAAKAAADYVTDDIDRDGIEKALLHFGLI